MTEKKRMPFVRCLTMLVMLLTLTGGMMAVSATAAPGDGSKAQSASFQTAGVTLDVCNTLFNAGLIDGSGAGVSGADLTVTDVPAGLTLDAATLAGVNAGECGLVAGFPPVPGGALTFAICDALDVNNDGAVDATEAIEISIDLDADGDVDAGEAASADNLCDAILFAVPGDDSTDAEGTTEGTETEPGSLVINNFACPQVEVPVARVSDPGVADFPGDAPEEGCVATPADFQIFVNGDFTSDPIEAFIDESGTFNGVPPTQDGVPHALFEPAFNVYFSIEIAPGEVTTATVLNPADDDAAIPSADDADNGIAADGAADTAGGASASDANDGGDTSVADGASASDGNDEGDTSVADGASASDGNDEGDTSVADGASASDGNDEGTEGGIISLPSTGQGGDRRISDSAIVLLFGVISMVALVGGFAWRQRRTC